jgi:hypothetical protein
MIGHDDKLVQKESPLFAIMRQREKQESGGRVPAKDRQAASRNGCDEKYTIEIHTPMIGRVRLDRL